MLLQILIPCTDGEPDVFLTPLKPREKVVTAEDVQSSLYFVHFNSTANESLSRPSSANADASRLTPITDSPVARKPLLPPRGTVTPPYPTADGSHGRQGRSTSPRKSQQIARKPVLLDTTNFSSGQSPDLDLPVLPRRPLPTPPQECPPPLPHRGSLHQENLRLLRHAEHSPDDNPYYRSYDKLNAEHRASEPLSEAQARSENEPGTLTLIRRDPATSAQWNVASIQDPPVLEVSSAALLNPSAAKRTKKGGAPLYLDISNPGYSKFISVPNDRSESRISTSTDSSDGMDPAPAGTFRRRIWMPGSRFAEHGYGHHRYSSSHNSVGGAEDMRKSMRVTDSQDFSAPSSDRRTKSYAFTSPWDGICEFSTGATGSSLKCRHALPHGTATVSELRFNLPASSKNATLTPTSSADKRSSYFAGHRAQQNNSTDSSYDSDLHKVFDEYGRLDLSLGRERAGGGLRGKQAKLGKLIVESEGLKMLDLVVAANVGLWWRVYERL